MSKKITLIHHSLFNEIYVGKEIPLFVDGRIGKLIVKEIKYVTGECSAEDYYRESFYLHFENSTKTLEVFDVNYVIRDEV